MKLWLVIPALLFVTLTLHAQSGFYTDPCDPVYYSGAYPPYCSQPYYPQFSFTATVNTLLTVNNDEAINALTRQVQQLSELVRELSAEIARAKTQQPQPRPSPSETIAPPTRAPAPPITFILRNGTHIVSQGYAIAGSMLWILTPSGYVRIALSNIDLVATQRENLKRGITFEVPEL
jgi:hypothetical protein